LLDSLGGDQRFGGFEIADWVQPVYVVDTPRWGMAALRGTRVFVNEVAGAVAGVFSTFIFMPGPTGAFLKRMVIASNGGFFINQSEFDPITVTQAMQIMSISPIPQQGAGALQVNFLCGAPPAAPARPLFEKGTRVAFPANTILAFANQELVRSDDPIWCPPGSTVGVTCNVANVAMAFLCEFEFPPPGPLIFP